MDQQTFPGPWRGMFACAAIMVVGFLASAFLARAFLPLSSGAGAPEQAVSTEP